MSEFFEKEGLIANEQHGFVKWKTCVTVLLETLDLITKPLSEGFSVDIVYLDFLKAFDLVSHRRLIQKLTGYGIKYDLLKWVQSFLSERRQSVVLSDISSSWLNVTSGFLKWSLLGPFYVCDVHKWFTRGDWRLLQVIREWKQNYKSY